MPHRCKLYFFQLLAVVSLVLAFIGVFVPGLPTTEFVLLCAWSSAKGSPRIHRYLHENRYTGPALHNWKNGKLITRRSKITATISMLVCAVILVAHPISLTVKAIAILCMFVVNVWIWSRPEPNSK